MAGAGYKLFQTGDVLTAAQVNTYLNEQTVMVFASAAARTSALTSVLAEGMVSYLQDTNAVEVYDGSAWVSIGSSGDITGVTAGTGISGGGTSGTVTITNDMATTITAAGDIVVGTGSGTYDNLPIGTTGQVLTADTTVSPYKVKWAAAAGFNPGAWTAYTPTVTSQSGSITSYSAASWYYQVGTIVFWTGVVKITNAGTAGGNMNVTLPFNTVTRTDYHTCGTTQEFAVSGKTGYIGAGSNESSASSRDYNNGTYFVTNNQIRFSLVYEKSA